MPNPRTPTQLKVVRGTARPDRANPAEPTPELLTIDVAHPPRWLKLSPLARRAWRDIAPLLIGMRVLTSADLVALSLLCDSLATIVVAKEHVAEHGATYETVGEGGARMVRKHPAVEIHAEASRFAKVMLGEFGMTPASRSKVSQVGSASKDPLSAWLEGTGS